MKCPRCGVELDEENFLVRDFFKDNGKYWCPECGHEWGKKEQKEGKMTPISEKELDAGYSWDYGRCHGKNKDGSRCHNETRKGYRKNNGEIVVCFTCSKHTNQEAKIRKVLRELDNDKK